MKIRTKVLLRSAITGALVLLTGGAHWLGLRDIERVREQINRAQDRVDAYLSVDREVKRSLRGLALSRALAADAVPALELMAWQVRRDLAATEESIAAEARIEGRTGRVRLKEKQLASVKGAIETWTGQVNDALMAGAGPRQPLPLIALSTAFDNLLGEAIAEAINLERREREELRALAVESARRASAVAAALTLTCVAFILFASLTLVSPLNRGLEKLLAKVRRMATGELAGEITELPRDELGVLGAAINNMAKQLAASDALLDKERGRIARELHDGAGQALTAARLLLVSLMKQNAPSQRLASTAKLVDEALEEIRRSTSALAPSSLLDVGFRQALERHCEAFSRAAKLEVSCRISPFLPPLPPSTEAALYRVVQEALANTARHAGATRAQIALKLVAKSLVLEITDDGRGFDGQQRIGVGLESMRERARLLGGSVQFSEPGESARIELALPLRREGSK